MNITGIIEWISRELSNIFNKMTYILQYYCQYMEYLNTYTWHRILTHFGNHIQGFFYCFTSHVYYFHLKCIIKQLLDSLFVLCKIISVSVRVVILSFGSANNSYLDISYHNKPHPIIVYYTSKNSCRVSHATRPGLKDAVKCILRFGFAHSNGGGGGSFRCKHCPNIASFELFANWNFGLYDLYSYTRKNWSGWCDVIRWTMPEQCCYQVSTTLVEFTMLISIVVAIVVRCWQRTIVVTMLLEHELTIVDEKSLWMVVNNDWTMIFEREQLWTIVGRVQHNIATSCCQHWSSCSFLRV